eukprot:jgi/Psemu1/286334/fgenesh1_pg.130_\
MKKTTTLALFVIFCTLDENATDAEDVTNQGDDGDGQLGLEDEIVLFFLFLFFAFCVSLFASFVCYVSCLDDMIMQQYAEEGELVEGEVVATEFTRGADVGVDNLGENMNSSQKEYFVSIEYMILLSENYPIRIRKQLRVLEGDFFHQGQSPTNCGIVDPCTFSCDPGNKAVLPTPKQRIQIIASRDSFFKSFQFDHGKMLQLLVMPNHHLSALPARQVERRLSTRYRLYSVSFALAAFSIAIFCFSLAGPLLHQLISEGLADGDGYLPSILTAQAPLHSMQVNFLYIMLALTPIPCIHHLLKGQIQQSLEGEYFETGGEVISGGADDSSISSRSEFGYIGMSLDTRSTFMQE